jgi:hypothetical protein
MNHFEPTRLGAADLTEADLVPEPGGRRKALLGCTPSPYPLPANLDEPVDVEWEAMK